MITRSYTQARPRIAALGMAAVMTLVVMAGIGTLAETQAARPELSYAAAQTQQVVVIGHRSTGG